MEIKLYVSNVEIDIPKYMSKVQSDKLGKYAALQFKKIMDPYVPMRTGMLANGTCMVKPWAVWYTTVYAHYQYAGEGFNFSHQYHPKACAKWDKAADAAHHDEFVQNVQAYIDSGALGLGK